MSRDIIVDGAHNVRFTVSDSEYAAIDWGVKGDDVVLINLEHGGFAALYWNTIGVVQAPGALPPPGSYPGWHIDARGPWGDISGLHINDATKDALVIALAVADTILEFTTLQGSDVKMPSASATYISFHPGDFVVPD